MTNLMVRFNSLGNAKYLVVLLIVSLLIFSLRLGYDAHVNQQAQAKHAVANTNIVVDDTTVLHATIQRVDKLLNDKTPDVLINKIRDAYLAGHDTTYANKCDHPRLKDLLSIPQICSRDTTIVIGGINRGQLASEVLTACGTFTLRGVEIQPKTADYARNHLKQFLNADVAIYNEGWSDKNAKMPFMDHKGEEHSEIAGIADGDSWFRWPEMKPSTELIEIRTLSSFVKEKGIKAITFMVIDTEGREPLIIKGMHLEEEENRKMFPMFAYELGGTWGARDPRHPKGSMSQFGVALYLELNGYELYLIGCNDFLPVTAGFFRRDILDEGYGNYCQGNTLAVHPEYANKHLLEKIKATTRVL